MKISNAKRTKLKTSPQTMIANLTGNSQANVSMVWSGKRNNEDISTATMLMYQGLAELEKGIIQKLKKQA